MVLFFHLQFLVVFSNSSGKRKVWACWGEALRGVCREEKTVEGGEGLGDWGMNVSCSQRQDRSSLRAGQLLLLLDRVVSL